MKEELALRAKITDGQMEGRTDGTDVNVSDFFPKRFGFKEENGYVTKFL